MWQYNFLQADEKKDIKGRIFGNKNGERFIFLKDKQKTKHYKKRKAAM
jgi:hypothetical protein